jgi:hypothetical protein
MLGDTDCKYDLKYFLVLLHDATAMGTKSFKLVGFSELCCAGRETNEKPFFLEHFDGRKEQEKSFYKTVLCGFYCLIKCVTLVYFGAFLWKLISLSAHPEAASLAK